MTFCIDCGDETDPTINIELEYGSVNIDIIWDDGGQFCEQCAKKEAYKVLQEDLGLKESE